MSNSKVVVVTGVSSGIGRATAAMLVERGCRVYGSVRDIEAANPIAGVELLEMDIRDDRSIRLAVQRVIDQEGRIDVLINNAGGALFGSVEETSVAEAQALFDTNVFGILRTTQSVLPQMRKQASGRIVNVSSVLGFLPAPYMGLYSASKHAVEGMSESLDHEVRKFGVRVVLVEPSFTKTSIDANAPRAACSIEAYENDRYGVLDAVGRSVTRGPDPVGVAASVVDAAVGPWRMRRTPKGQASLLRVLRRFMPARPVDSAIRKQFGLA